MSSPDPRILRLAIAAPQAGYSLDPDAMVKATEALTTGRRSAAVVTSRASRPRRTGSRT
jgi:hypothetical protein